MSPLVGTVWRLQGIDEVVMLGRCFAPTVTQVVCKLDMNRTEFSHRWVGGDEELKQGC